MTYSVVFNRKSPYVCIGNFFENLLVDFHNKEFEVSTSSVKPDLVDGSDYFGFFIK